MTLVIFAPLGPPGGNDYFTPNFHQKFPLLLGAPAVPKAQNLSSQKCCLGPPPPPPLKNQFFAYSCSIGDFLVKPQKPVEASSPSSACTEPVESALTGFQGLTQKSPTGISRMDTYLLVKTSFKNIENPRRR